MTVKPQILEFLERVGNDPAVKLRFEGALSGSNRAGDVVNIANGLGYDFTVDELLAYQEGAPSLGAVALDDATLDDVSGGAPIFKFF